MIKINYGIITVKLVYNMRSKSPSGKELYFVSQDLNLYIPSKTHNNACLSCLKITHVVVMRPVCSKEVVHHSGYCINVNQEENLLFSHLGKFQQESKIF